jgi:RNA polymerase sigma factor (sigma-70 family)
MLLPIFAESRTLRHPQSHISSTLDRSRLRGAATNRDARWTAPSYARLLSSPPAERGQAADHSGSDSDFHLRMNPPAFESSRLELLEPEVERPSGVEVSRKAGDRVSGADLMRLLYRQMRSLAGPRADLEDIVQAAAERAWKALPRFEGRAALSTWTYGIAYRTLLDHDRWYRRFRRRFEPALNDDPAVEEDRDSELRLREKRRAQHLHRALGLLPAAKRAVVVLHDLEGLEVSEIAGVVGANERTVRSRLRDARKKLVELLSAEPLFETEALR